jgi:hypothetical protein
LTLSIRAFDLVRKWGFGVAINLVERGAWA